MISVLRNLWNIFLRMVLSGTRWLVSISHRRASPSRNTNAFQRSSCRERSLAVWLEARFGQIKDLRVRRHVSSLLENNEFNHRSSIDHVIDQSKINHRSYRSIIDQSYIVQSVMIKTETFPNQKVLGNHWGLLCNLQCSILLEKLVVAKWWCCLVKERSCSHAF